MDTAQETIADQYTSPVRQKLPSSDDNQTAMLILVRHKRCEISFERLYEYYAPRICAFLRQKGVDERISQDIMQDVMARVWLRADQFNEHKASASAWIFTIARNRFIDVIRQTKRRELDWHDPLLVGKEEPAPDARLRAEERNLALRDAIDQLPTDQADVLNLIYVNGMKQQAVAEKLSIPLNTVKSRLRLALEKLRIQMEHA